MATPWYKRWEVWKRVLLGLAGALTLAGQMLSVTTQQGQVIAYLVAVLNLAISLLPDQAVARVTGLRAE